MAKPLLTQVVADLEELVALLYCEEMARRLVCVECQTLAPRDARGWRTYLTVDDEVATYCPDCAREEFGDGS